jgi:tetraacyldisaccharide 4'-kinase
VDALRGQRLFAFCGIGNPDAFFEQIEESSGELIGTRRFADHHAYSASELGELIERAKDANAAMVLTTEKDWVKIAPMRKQLPAHPPIMRVGISVQIQNGEEARLVERVMQGIGDGDELLGWKK